jgi:hypothetical protein
MQRPKKRGGYGKKPNENRAVTTVTTYSTLSELEVGKKEDLGGKIEKSAFPGTHVESGLRWLHPPADTTPVKYLAISEVGGVIGEDHWCAKLTNARAEEIRDKYEAHPPGHPEHVGYRLLAKEYGVSKRTIRDIVNHKGDGRSPRWRRRGAPALRRQV